MKDLISDCHNARVALDNDAVRLRNYARAFLTTGNTIMGNRLFEIADRINEQTEIVHKAVGNAIHQSYVDAQRSTAAVFEAALAGAIVAKRS